MLNSFSVNRHPGPLRVTWFDDHPNDVARLVKGLKKYGMAPTLFGNPDDVVDTIQEAFAKKKEIPDVCVTDLMIDRNWPETTGQMIGTRIMALYQTNLQVPARVGVASHIPDLVAKATESTFAFRFLTSDLAGGGQFYSRFAQTIEKHATGLWLDRWCVEYMNRCPIEPYDLDNRRYVRGEYSFGVVREVGRDNVLVWLWDPTCPQSGHLCRTDRVKLEPFGIVENQQPFRIVTFSDRDQPAAQVNVIQRLAGPGDFTFEALRSQFDASEFEGF